MKKISQVWVLMLGVVMVVMCLANSGASQTIVVAPQSNTATLFAVNKYQDSRKSCLNFLNLPEGDCPLRYGSLYAGDDWDWFETSAARSNRTAMRDLGELSWTDSFKVPIVEPFPKLKPGEERHVTIDTSGADGADGLPGAPGRDGADADGIVRPRQRPENNVGFPSPPLSSRPRHDGKPKIDPIFAKAIVNHMYVIHLVDDVNDFYALVRVEAVKKGDQCTVSWRLVSAPDATAETK